MCHYVTAIVPGTAEPALLFEDHGLFCDEIQNPYVASHIAAGDRQIVTTRSCDCGTALGSGNRAPAGRLRPSKIEKLRKKGWSEAKIRRWFAQKLDVQHRREEASGVRQALDVEQWRAFLGDALERMRRIGLLLHMYSGGLESERIALTRERVPRTELTTELLLSMKEDVVYEFVK